MAWERRGELLDIRVRPSIVLGGLVTTGGLVVLVIGHLSNTNLIEEFSVVITVAGLTLLLMGPSVLRRYWFPVAYLLAMVPFWDVLTSRLHPYFQIYSAGVGVGLLKAVGIPVLRDGVFILLPNVTLEVAQACSGINYLIAVLFIGVPATLLFVSHWAKRLFILVVAVGIAIGSNGMRVAIVSLYAYYGQQGPTGDMHGPFALFRSLAISGIGFVVLFALISHFADRETRLRNRRPTEVPRGSEERPPTKLQVWPILLATGLLISCAAFQQWHQPVGVTLSRELATFPTTMGKWRFQGATPISPESGLAIFDEKLSREYLSPDGIRINLQFGYLREQTSARKLAGYDMLSILNRRDQPAETVQYGSAITVKDFVVSENGERYHVTYWYILGGRTVSEDYEARLVTGARSLLNRVSNGCVVVLRKELRPHETVTDSRSSVGNFAGEFMQAITRYLPRN